MANVSDMLSKRSCADTWRTVKQVRWLRLRVLAACISKHKSAATVRLIFYFIKRCNQYVIYPVP